MLIKNYAINQNMQFMGKKVKKNKENDEKSPTNKVLPKVLFGAGFLAANQCTNFINGSGLSLGNLASEKNLKKAITLFNNEESKQLSVLSDKMLAKHNLDNKVNKILIGKKSDINQISLDMASAGISKNPINNFLYKNIYKKLGIGEEAKQIYAQQQIYNLKEILKGENACFFMHNNTIYLPENQTKISYAGLHETGHAINANTSKFWKTMQQTGTFLPNLAPIVVLTALLTEKPEKNDKNENKNEKISTKIAKFIKKHVGLITFSLFLPKIAEEAKASLRAYNFAKQNISQETAKKLKQAYNAGISSYIAEGIATALIAVGLSKAKDIVVDLINKDKSKKATKKED